MMMKIEIELDHDWKQEGDGFPFGETLICNLIVRRNSDFEGLLDRSPRLSRFCRGRWSGTETNR